MDSKHVGQIAFGLGALSASVFYTLLRKRDKKAARFRGESEAAYFPGASSGDVSASFPSFEAIKAAFELDRNALERLIEDFGNEMDVGLGIKAQSKPSSMKMLPSYVDSLPSGKEEGSYFALDLGGTNFRVLQCRLKGNGEIDQEQSAYSITQQQMTSTAQVLFDAIATHVINFLTERGLHATSDVPLGFTFSFPVEQDRVDRGELIHWTKGFSASGVEKRDVVGLLKEAFDRKGWTGVRVVALVNDTVGTLAARAYEDHNCRVGIILGTGSNGAYYESSERIPKLSGLKTEGMIINMEWGGFDKVPATEFDEVLDRESINVNSQLLEKMISGMYLGEISRQVLLRLQEDGLFSRNGATTLGGRGSFQTALMAEIAVDESTQLENIKSVLEEQVGIHNTTLTDRRAVKEVCYLVSRRAAQLSAAALVAVLRKTGRVSGVEKTTAAIDGSVFKKYPGFKYEMERTLLLLLGDKVAKKVKLAEAVDGSGKGAAIIAAVMHKQ